MPNPFYNMLMQMQMGAPQPFPQPSAPPMNAFQRASYLMQTLQNPAAFAKQAFPDIPDAICNNPNQILQYLQQTRGISPQQINSLASMGGR